MDYSDFVSLREAKIDPDIGRFLKNRDALYWQIRKRETNGLLEAGAVTKAPDGEWWINKPAYFQWFVRGMNSAAAEQS